MSNHALVSTSNCTHMTTTPPLYTHSCSHTRCLPHASAITCTHGPIAHPCPGHVHCPHLVSMLSYTHMHTADLESAGTYTLKSTGLLASADMFTHTHSLPNPLHSLTLIHLPIATCICLKAPAPTCAQHPWELQHKQLHVHCLTSVL